MSDVERRTSDKEELPEKAKGGGGAQPPKEIKTCEVTERRTQTWVTTWYGSTAEEAEENFATNPDGDFKECGRERTQTDLSEFTCPDGHMLVPLSWRGSLRFVGLPGGQATALR